MFDVVLKKLTDVVEDNKTTILTGIGVAGTVTATVLSGRAGFKAAQILEAETSKKDLSPKDQELLAGWEPSLKEKIWLVGPQFLPAAGTCAIAVTATIFSNRLSAKETAAMAAMYSMSDKTFQEYKEKVQEKLGQNKEQAVRDEIAQERVNNNPPVDSAVIITGNGDVLCYDVLSDRYFRSTVENIKKAENEVNSLILNEDEVSLGRFYEEIGLKVTPFSDTVGWNLENRCEVDITSVLSPDQQPCVQIDFRRWPKSDYNRVFHP